MPASSSSLRTRSKVRCAITRWPAMASPTTPSPNIWTAVSARIGAEDQRLDVAGSVAVEDPVDQEGAKAISAASAKRMATTVNTRSGSYRT